MTFLRHKNIKDSQALSIHRWDFNPFKSRPEPLLKEKPVLLPTFISNTIEMLEINWNSAHSSQKVVWGIIGLNALVFLGWRLPAAHSFMNRHFVHHPYANRPYTLLTCVFSHQQIAHFAFNMMALNSLFTFYQLSNRISTEQTVTFYLSAGYL